MDKTEDKYSYKAYIAFPVIYKDFDIFRSFKKIGVMAYELDDEEIVVRSRQGSYKYILNDIVYL